MFSIPDEEVQMLDDMILSLLAMRLVGGGRPATEEFLKWLFQEVLSIEESGPGLSPSVEVGQIIIKKQE